MECMMHPGNKTTETQMFGGKHLNLVSSECVFNLSLVCLVEEKGSWVRGADGRVEDQDEDYPVPDGLEGGVMKDDEPGGSCHLQLVFREYLVAKRQNLARIFFFNFLIFLF